MDLICESKVGVTDGISVLADVPSFTFSWVKVNLPNFSIRLSITNETQSIQTDIGLRSEAST